MAIPSSVGALQTRPSRRRSAPPLAELDVAKGSPSSAAFMRRAERRPRAPGRGGPGVTAAASARSRPAPGAASALFSAPGTREDAASTPPARRPSRACGERARRRPRAAPRGMAARRSPPPAGAGGARASLWWAAARRSARGSRPSGRCQERPRAQQRTERRRARQRTDFR